MVELTRRTLFRAGGLAAITAPVLLRQPAIASAPAAEQVHLTFGADAAREMTVSWTTAGAVRRPRVRLGSAAGGHGTTVDARFGEEGAGAEPHEDLLELVVPGEAVVVCSQGGVIPRILHALLTDGRPVRARKGSVWALTLHDGRLFQADDDVLA